MSSDEHSDKPVMVLLLTEHTAGLLNAALSHYRVHLRRHTPVWSEGDGMSRAAPDIEELQRYLVEEARNPTIPPIDVEAIQKLSDLNRAMQSVRTASHGSEAWQQASALFIVARAWLTQIRHIPVYFSKKYTGWHFGGEDPIEISEGSSLHNDED
jgi:hypothetical protein